MWLYGGLFTFSGAHGTPWVADPARILEILGTQRGSLLYWGVDAAHGDCEAAVDPKKLFIRMLYTPV